MISKISYSCFHMLGLLEKNGSLSAVADELHVSPAAVSMAIARAEQILQVPLVDRRKRPFQLTEAGKALADHWNRLSGSKKTAEQQIIMARSRLSAAAHPKQRSHPS